MDRGAWQATVRGVTKSRTRLSSQHYNTTTKTTRMNTISYFLFIYKREGISFSVLDRFSNIEGFAPGVKKYCEISQ